MDTAPDANWLDDMVKKLIAELEKQLARASTAVDAGTAQSRAADARTLSALFHPLDDYYGLSPLEVAGAAIEVHNTGAQWTKALLDNAARPSGALIYKGPDGSGLSDEQFAR